MLRVAYRAVIGMSLSLLIAAGASGMMRPLSTEVETAPVSEVTCAVRASYLNSKLPLSIPGAYRSASLRVLRADSNRSAFQGGRSCASAQGHKLPNGLNAPLLI